MCVETDLKLKEIIGEEMQDNFEESRDELRRRARTQILKVQDENRRTYNMRRRKAKCYKLGDLVAIKRTQFGPGLKLKPSYKVTKVKGGE